MQTNSQRRQQTGEWRSVAEPHRSDPVFTGPAEVRIQGQAPTRLPDSPRILIWRFSFSVSGQEIVPVRSPQAEQGEVWKNLFLSESRLLSYLSLFHLHFYMTAAQSCQHMHLGNLCLRVFFFDTMQISTESQNGY